MSPRAACRLEALGFAEVYDYVPGKVDWLAHALPTASDEPLPKRAGDALDTRVVTCEPDARVADVREQVADSPFGFALVVSANRVVLGRLRKTVLEGDADARAEHVMEPGPSTVRPHVPLEPLLGRLAERNLRAAIVTTPEGQLLGVVRREG